MFLGGALQSVAAMLWLLLEMAVRHAVVRCACRGSGTAFIWGLAALLRVLADMLPVQAALWLYLAAAAAWLACFAPWVSRYLPFYWRPRADGKVG